MKPISSLLVASDFSFDSQHAMVRAELLCKTAGISRGTILHVVETGLLDNVKGLLHLSDEGESTLLTDAMKTLEATSASIFVRTGVTLEPRVRSGKIVSAIIEEAAEAEMVLLGAKGRHVPDTTIGSTPGRIIRESRKPVLVVKTEPVQPYRKVLVAVDFSDHSRLAAEWAARIAPTAPLYLVHIYQAMFEGKMKYAGVTEDAINEYRHRARLDAQSEMDRFINSLTGVNKSRVHRMIRHGDHPSLTLVKAIRKTGADLVAAGKHGKTLMEYLLMGSVTQRLLELSPCDLLVS